MCHERPSLGYDSRFMYLLMTLGCFSGCMKENTHQHCTEFGHIVRNFVTILSFMYSPPKYYGSVNWGWVYAMSYGILGIVLCVAIY